MNASFWPIVGIGILLLWVIYAAIALGVPVSFAEWYKTPGNSVRLITWIGSIFVVLITVVNPIDSFLGSLRNDAITVAVTVIVIEELNRYRSEQEDKQRIIRQMGSRSNEFALEAARLVIENGWSNDIALYQNGLMGANLQKANLAKANLQKVYMWGVNLQEAYLWGANLREAILREANLQQAKLLYANLQQADLRKANLYSAFLLHTNLLGANLQGANLQMAQYTSDTKWPDDINPRAVGAILVEWSEVESDFIPVESTTD